MWDKFKEAVVSAMQVCDRPRVGVGRRIKNAGWWSDEVARAVKRRERERGGGHIC